MKIPALLLASVLVSACSAPSNDGAAIAPGATPAPAAVPAPAATPAASDTMTNAETKRATAHGVVEDVDMAAKTITLSHGPVEALGWPAMTMGFQAPSIDLAKVKKGDKVDVELLADGMDATITKLDKSTTK